MLNVWMIIIRYLRVYAQPPANQFSIFTLQKN